MAVSQANWEVWVREAILSKEESERIRQMMGDPSQVIVAGVLPTAEEMETQRRMYEQMMKEVTGHVALIR